MLPDELFPQFAQAKIQSGFFGPLRTGTLEGEKVAFKEGATAVTSLLVGDLDVDEEQVTAIYLSRLADGEAPPPEGSPRRLERYLGSAGLGLSRRYVLNSVGRRGYPELLVSEVQDGLLKLGGRVKEVGIFKGNTGIQVHLDPAAQTRESLEADARIVVGMYKALRRDAAALAIALSAMPRPPMPIPMQVFFCIIALSTLAGLAKSFPNLLGRLRGSTQRLITSAASKAPARAPEQSSPQPFSPPVPPQDAVRVSISISKDAFQPAGFLIGTHDRPDLLSSQRPPGLLGEPDYQGKERRYGALSLGTVHKEPFLFALDLAEGAHPVLYFDRDHDGDLRDEQPLKNQGTGLFASVVTIPFAQIAKDAGFPGDYALWLFTNESLWPAARLAHYSRTSLAGSVTIEGKKHQAWLIEGAANDGDFTEAGVGIDLDGNGRFDWRTERFASGAAVPIGSRNYSFEVGW